MIAEVLVNSNVGTIGSAAPLVADASPMIDPFGRAAPSDFLPFEQVRQGVGEELRRAAGRRAFFAWFDRARADVVYAAGHEHPGDPSHPDHEHRH